MSGVADVAGPRCRQCGSAGLLDRGAIARGRIFAGQPLAPPWPGGRLRECRACALVFRDPLRADDEYAALYARAPGEVYAAPRLRADQRLVLARLQASRAGGSVLDVGCFDGALLASLPGEWRRLGVEPSRAAASASRARGVEIVAAGVRELESLALAVDAACAVDVIEHVPDPLQFLRAVRAALREGGEFVLTSGDASAPAFRAAGGRYWYCSFPEHLSFVSPPWLALAAPRCGFALRSVERFRYAADSPGTRGVLAATLGRARRRAMAAAESAVASLAGLRAPAGSASRAAADAYRTLGPRYVLGFPGAAVDHFLAVLVAEPRDG